MLKWVDQYHPDRIVDSSFGKKLPERWRKHIKLLIFLLAWYGFVSGLVSILSSFAWIIDAANFLYANSGQLKPVLAAAGYIIHGIVEAWHNITSPLHRLLFGWLPFKVPRTILDVLVIASIIGSGYFRAWIVSRPYRYLMKVWSGPEGRTLSEVGRIAVAKRIAYALGVLGDGSATEQLKDKAEAELVSALDEMTEGLDDRSFAIIEGACSLPTDEAQDFFLTCAFAPSLHDNIRHNIMIRSLFVASFIGFCLITDIIYVMIIL